MIWLSDHAITEICFQSSSREDCVAVVRLLVSAMFLIVGEATSLELARSMRRPARKIRTGRTGEMPDIEPGTQYQPCGKASAKEAWLKLNWRIRAT